MNSLKRIRIASIIILLLFLISCNIFEPKPEPEPDPGSRNYVWKIDTLYMPMNYISTIWGASPNNLWAMGAGGTPNDRLLHYDGTNWSTYTNEVINCTGNIIFGFSEDNIWMGGGAGWPDRGAGIWHYDGEKWEKYYTYTVNDTFNLMYINDIWGPSPDDVYACGLIAFPSGTSEYVRGFALHYDGNNWSEISRAYFNSQFIKINKQNNKIYIFSYGINNEDGDDDVEFYTINNDTLQQIYSNKRSAIFAGMTDIDGKVYFVIGNDVFLYENKVFNKVLSIDYNGFLCKVCGRNEKDIFFLMLDGIVHYNGTDMEYIYQLPSSEMRFMEEPLIIGDDIYFCLYHSGFNEFVLHGRLIEE